MLTDSTPHFSLLYSKLSLNSSYSAVSVIHRVPEAPPPPFFGFLFSFHSYSFHFSRCLLYHCFLDLSSLLPAVPEHRNRVCKTTAKTLFHTLPPICSSPGPNLVYLLLIINTDKMKTTAWKSQMTLSFERLLQLLSF